MGGCGGGRGRGPVLKHPTENSRICLDCADLFHLQCLLVQIDDDVDLFHLQCLLFQIDDGADLSHL